MIEIQSLIDITIYRNNFTKNRNIDLCHWRFREYDNSYTAEAVINLLITYSKSDWFAMTAFIIIKINFVGGPARHNTATLSLP